MTRDDGPAALPLPGGPRRAFLARLGALAVCSGVARASSPAEPANEGRVGLIDMHHHVFPPDFLQAALDGYLPQNRPVVSAWTPERTLAEMESNGVAKAIVSVTSPGTWLGGVEKSRALTRKCNEYSARLARDHVGRFGFFAALPLPDVQGSLQEVAYALDVLKADGIGLMTNYDDKWPGDAAFAPVFEELDRRQAAVFFHPTAATCDKDLVRGVPRAWAELPHETTRAVLSLLVSGALVRYRGIHFIFAHAGGTLPMLAGRIAHTARFVDDFAQRAPNGLEYELRRLHYDVAGSADRAAIGALMNLVPTSQILFGSDYPFLPITATAGSMPNLGLSNGDLRAIGRENATALFAGRPRT